MAPIYSQNGFQYCVRPPSWICKIWIFFVKSPYVERNFGSAYQIWSKSDNSRLRYGDNVMFKMAAVLHLENCSFGCVLYLHLLLHLSSEFRINRPMWRWYVAENDFQYGVRPPSWFLYDVIILHQKTAFLFPNFLLNFEEVMLRIFWNIWHFMFQYFGLKLPISGLILTTLVKIRQNVKTKYSNPQKAHPWRKTRLISVERWRFIRRRYL